MKAGVLLVALLIAAGAHAEALRLPANAIQMGNETFGQDTFGIAAGPWDGTTVPKLPVEGLVTLQSWRIDSPDITSEQLMAPLRGQLDAQGYDIILDCATNACGGFDFRFSIDMLGPPDMFVNLGDFRHLSAWRLDDDGAQTAVALLVSRSEAAGYIHLTHIGSNGSVTAETSADRLRALSTPGSLASQLEENGSAILTGLTFERGASSLRAGRYDSLQALSDFLASRPNLQVALVGHTDSEGSLDGNIALSKRRAQSVLEELVNNYSVSRAQLDAQGMGYLAPIASNQSTAGREANRRVEVIVTSTR